MFTLKINDDENIKHMFELFHHQVHVQIKNYQFTQAKLSGSCPDNTRYLFSAKTDFRWGVLPGKKIFLSRKTSLKKLFISIKLPT